MIRKLTFGLVLVTAFIVAACGRQVTPNPPGLGAGGALPGYTVVKFDVNGIFNFSSYGYWVVFNTTGNGLTPLTNAQQSNWKAYSAALLAGGAGGATFAGVGQFLKNSNPAIPPAFIHINTTPQLFQYIPNSNGTGTEFQMTFQRTVFIPINATPTPIPSPGHTPVPLPHIWLFNAYTTQANFQNQLLFIDSMGSGGATDTSFVSPQLDINTCFDQTFYKQQDINPPSDPASQIVSIEIANNPSPGPHSSPCQ
jgi:hypothetical protein